MNLKNVLETAESLRRFGESYNGLRWRSGGNPGGEHVHVPRETPFRMQRTGSKIIDKFFVDAFFRKSEKLRRDSYFREVVAKTGMTYEQVAEVLERAGSDALRVPHLKEDSYEGLCKLLDTCQDSEFFNRTHESDFLSYYHRKPSEAAQLKAIGIAPLMDAFVSDIIRRDISSGDVPSVEEVSKRYTKDHQTKEFSDAYYKFVDGACW